MAFVKLERQGSNERTVFDTVYQIDVKKTDGSKVALTGLHINDLMTYADSPEARSFTIYDEKRGSTEFLFGPWLVQEASS